MKKILYTIAHRLRVCYWYLFRPRTLGVSILIENEKKILLVKPYYLSEWVLPGGGIDTAELPEDAICREVREECGIDLDSVIFIQAYGNFSHRQNGYILFYYAKTSRLDIQPSMEIEQVDFFDSDHLPKNIAPGSRRRIQEWQEHSFSWKYW